MLHMAKHVAIISLSEATGYICCEGRAKKIVIMTGAGISVSAGTCTSARPVSDALPTMIRPDAFEELHFPVYFVLQNGTT